MKNIVPVEQRPTKQMNKINLKNVFSVTLGDAGEVALIDATPKKIISIVKTGYAGAHLASVGPAATSTSSARRAASSLIDMWMEKPAVVAEVKVPASTRVRSTRRSSRASRTSTRSPVPTGRRNT